MTSLTPASFVGSPAQNNSRGNMAMLNSSRCSFVIPAKAGIQLARGRAKDKDWTAVFLASPKRSRFGFAQAGAGVT
ncbi:MAG: hypothetical protein WAN73_13855, partial [Methyloceanibacter sp.]